MLGVLLKSYFLTKYRFFYSREQLEKWQHKKVVHHLKWVMKHSSFYRNFYKDLHLDNWKEFPLIEKKEMMKNFDELNTCKIKKEEAYTIALEGEENFVNSSQIEGITIGLSSGTSGNRGLFLVSKKERLNWAGAILAKVLPESLFKRQKIAFFFRTISPLYTTLKSKRIQFEYYALQDPIEQHVERLNKELPTLLVGPPSFLKKLAGQVKNGHLKVNFKKIISVAEVLDPLDEVFISEAFHQKIHQIYQATEGFLATTCEYGTLHLNEDMLVIQKEKILGDPFKFYPIITDFNRFSQPILRYRLNDILEECKNSCPCGSLFTAIESIEGRSDDIFYFEEKDRLKPIFPDFIRKAVITAHPLITEYKIIQHSPMHLEVCLYASFKEEAEIKQAIYENLTSLLKRYEVTLPHISFSPYKEEKSTKKLRRIERKFFVEEKNRGA